MAGSWPSHTAGRAQKISAGYYTTGYISSQIAQAILAWGGGWMGWMPARPLFHLSSSKGPSCPLRLSTLNKHNLLIVTGSELYHPCNVPKCSNSWGIFYPLRRRKRRTLHYPAHTDLGLSEDQEARFIQPGQIDHGLQGGQTGAAPQQGQTRRSQRFQPYQQEGAGGDLCLISASAML